MTADLRLLWDFYWPVAAIALAIGVIAGLYAFRPVRREDGDWDKGNPRVAARRRNHALALAGGAVLALGLGAVWHGPLGAGERLATTIEQAARAELTRFEMGAVTARLERAPLRRTLLLSGPADDFQRGELVRILTELPGPSDVRWSGASGGGALPLLVEAELLALIGFCLGLTLSYLIELRRRSRAQWRW